MNKQIKIALIGGVILVMSLLVWMFSAGDNSKQSGPVRKAFVSSNWNNRFQVFGKKPMGLYLFSTLAKAHLDTNRNIHVAHEWNDLDSLVTMDNTNKTFLFVGSRFGVYSDEFEAILKEVNKGSDLFLAYHDLTTNITDELFDSYNTRFDYAPAITIKTPSSNHYMINLFQNDTVAKSWPAFGKYIKTRNQYSTLSSFRNMANLIRINEGQGQILLMTTPSVFYNYQLKRKSGFKYAEFVLNKLPKNQDIILLEFGRLTDDYGSEEEEIEEEEGQKQDDSYLVLIFGNPTLLKAMLLAIFGIILFVLFRSKRIRPVVPYIGKKKDMTLAFADTITSIYFAKRQPYGLLQVQKKNFYSMIQKHFYIDLNRGDQENARNSLAEKSNYSRKKIDDLLDAFNTTKVSTVNDQYVSRTLKSQQAFYREVGIISDKTIERTSKRESIYKRSLMLPALFILVGLFLFFFGLYYLVSSIGIGIVFWPLGIILIALGIMRMTNPYLIVKENEWTYYSPIGRKRAFRQEEIRHIEILTSGVIVNFEEGEKLVINYWDLSRFDHKQFNGFITKLHTQEL